jgi:hypothetical protein
LSAPSYWGTAAAAALLAAAPLVVFLTGNAYPLASPEAGALLAACVAAGAVLGLSAFLGATVAALLLGAGAVLALDLLFGLHASKAALVLVPLACLVLRRHIALIITATLCVLLLAMLVPRTAFARSDRPVILHLVLDEHIGLEGIPRELPEGAAFARWLADAWVGHGFRVYAGAYSEYFDTRNSIANLLNFSSRGDDWAHLAEEQKKPYVLTESAYFRLLAARGYRLHVYQSDYMDFCRVPGLSYAGCSAYRANSIAALRRTDLDARERAQFILNSFLATSSYLKRLSALVDYEAVSRIGPLAVVPVLQRLENDLRRAEPGEAYFAHLLIPHYPYAFDESCRVRAEIDEWLYNAVSPNPQTPNTEASRAQRYPRYFAQIRCQQRLLERLFDAMKQAGVWDDALVMVHGDHGSRIAITAPLAAHAARLTERDLRDGFSTLFAVRKAGMAAGVAPGARALPQLLREALGLPVEPLAHKVYLRQAGQRALMPLPRGTGPAPRAPADR